MAWPSVKIGFGAHSLGLAQQFVLAAGLTITASMTLLTVAISQRIEASMLQSAAEEGALLIEIFLGPSAQELASSRRLSAESTRRLDDLLAGKLGDRVRLIKIWLPDGTLVYSTNKDSIGARFPSSQITTASQGKVTGEIDYLEEPENITEPRRHHPFIEIYAPLFRTGKSEIIAVGEVNSDGRRIASELTSIRLASVAIIGAVTAPMMLFLFLMVRRASKAVARHEDSLIQKVAEAKTLALQNDRLRRVADEARLEAVNSTENLLVRIGQDLHDGPIQLVSLLMLKLTDPASKGSARRGSDGARDTSTQLLATRILADLRNISTGLVLPELEGLTASETLRLAVKNHEVTTGTTVCCHIGDLPGDLALPVRICLSRIVQEGLNNAFHHAKAKGQRVDVSADSQWIMIVVGDAGPGFARRNCEQSHGRRGLGIAGLRSRVEALHGTFELTSQHDTGTQIRAKLPIHHTPI